MNKFKKFRQARGYTQKEVAEMLKTTQQTVARWESGQAEPSLATLRDLAMIFSTSVDDLLGKNPLSDEVVTNSYFSLDDGDEHFWGHLGILLPGEKYTRWYPITLKQANRLDAAINRISLGEPWLSVSTLNNRMLLINVPEVHRIRMLDDDADMVVDDWELGWDSYEGHSLEVYRALASWAMGVFDEEEELSQTFKEELEELIKEEGLTEDLVHERVIDTRLHFTNGQLHRSTPDEDRLFNAFIQVEYSAIGDVIFDLSEPDKGLTSYVPAKAICMLDMPLYQIMDAAKREHEELESMEADTGADS